MIGKVAKCRRGYIGIILGRTKNGVYEGFCLTPGREGRMWQSNNPELIGTLDDWVMRRHAEILEELGGATLALQNAFDYPTRRDLT